MKRGDDQFKAGIEGHDPKTPWKELLLVNVIAPLLAAFHDFAGIASARRQDDAPDHFALSVHDCRPVSYRTADLPFGPVSDIHRRATSLLHDDVFDVL